MMRRVFVVWVLILVLTMPLLAQDEAPSPFITQTFFADGVEILHIYPIADNENRRLHIYDAGEWLHLPYPEEVTRLDGEGASNSPYLVPYTNGWLVLSGDNTTWYVNRTGTFYEHHFLCYPNYEQIHDYMRSYGRLAWIYAHFGDRQFLCNMTTNEISPELPEETYWGPGNFGFSTAIEPSPDGRYLVLLASRNYEASLSEIYYRYRAYSYDTQTQIFRFLGDFGRQELVGVGRWFSDIHVNVGTSGMSEGSGSNEYVADVTQINSLVNYTSQVASRLPQPQNNEQPNEEDRVYLSESPRTRVVKIEHTTGEHITLFMGEAEAIHSVSPEGGYAIITLGNNGVAETIPETDELRHPDIAFYFPDLYTNYIIDLTDGRLITVVPNSAEWLTETHLYTEIQLLAFSGNSLDITELDGRVLSKLANEGQIIIHTIDNQVILYDVETDNTVIIIPDLGIYSIDLYEHINNPRTFSIHLNHPEIDILDLVVVIRLPD